MNHLQTDALVLREAPYKEADKLLTLLTRAEGKCTVRVRGARRIGGKLMAASQMFVYAQMTLFEHKGYYTLDDAQVIERFDGLRADLVKLALSCHLSELCETLSGEVGDENLLRLMLNSLFALSSRTDPPERIRAAATLKMMALSGYLPDIAACAHCDEPPEDPVFVPDLAHVYCARCTDSLPAQHGKPMRISAGVWQAMLHILHGPEKRLFSFDLPVSELNMLALVCETFMRAQLDRDFRTLTYYKGLR